MDFVFPQAQSLAKFLLPPKVCYDSLRADDARVVSLLLPVTSPTVLCHLVGKWRSKPRGVVTPRVLPSVISRMDLWSFLCEWLQGPSGFLWLTLNLQPAFHNVPKVNCRPYLNMPALQFAYSDVLALPAPAVKNLMRLKPTSVFDDHCVLHFRSAHGLFWPGSTVQDVV